MNKKILFFSSWPKSHLFPLKSLISFLQKKNFEVYILTIKSNKKIVENLTICDIIFVNTFIKGDYYAKNY